MGVQRVQTHNPYLESRADEVLHERLLLLARERPRYRYRRLRVLIEREGERVNHKRRYRIYRAAGLCLNGRSADIVFA
ncbi:hypothetical protein ACPOL_1406 [Acidisarcina polymorpha]|uniref:Mobile element protein n=2 Tax=Acidisarcina polymorpha TaxID=2211140 RepID=A0A2Z5FW75_9BACT|nr:hypothetical protein ACPOL_1406 [Acidisarcina polymorpha]